MSDIPSWHIIGEWFDNCSCAVPRPCTFAQAPDKWVDDGILAVRAERDGNYADPHVASRVGGMNGNLTRLKGFRPNQLQQRATCWTDLAVRA